MISPIIYLVGTVDPIRGDCDVEALDYAPLFLN